jgi:hypothetical protein
MSDLGGDKDDQGFLGDYEENDAGGGGGGDNEMANDQEDNVQS